MKYIIYSIIAIIFCNCSSETAPNCLKIAGEMRRKEFNVEQFDTITAYDKIKVVIKQAPEQRIILETGEYVMDAVSVVNESGNLILKNVNQCHMFKDYDITTVYIETPNLHTIKNRSGTSITSEGILAYDTLHLVSENYNKVGDYRVDGTFDVHVACKKLNVVINNLCTTTVRGNTSSLNIFYADGDARFEGRALQADSITVFHRGTNDIIVNPQKRLTGTLVSTGNMILTHTPPVLEVEALYKGKVIIE